MSMVPRFAYVAAIAISQQIVAIVPAHAGTGVYPAQEASVQEIRTGYSQVLSSFQPACFSPFDSTCAYIPEDRGGPSSGSSGSGTR